MSHQRKLIRNAIAGLLKGNTDCGDRVFSSRAHAIMGEPLPLILVYTRTDTAERYIEAPKEYKRTAKLAVEIVAEKTEGKCLDDELDDLCRQVETLIMRDDRLGDLASEIELGDTEIDFDSDGEVPFAAARLTFDVVYFDQLPAPEEADKLDGFNTVNVKIDQHPIDGKIEIESQFDLNPTP